MVRYHFRSFQLTFILTHYIQAACSLRQQMTQRTGGPVRVGGEFSGFSRAVPLRSSSPNTTPEFGRQPLTTAIIWQANFPQMIAGRSSIDFRKRRPAEDSTFRSRQPTIGTSVFAVDDLSDGRPRPSAAGRALSAIKKD